MNKKVAIIGNGWVGTAMQQLFPQSVTFVVDYDKAIKSGTILKDREYTDQQEVINKCEIAFICVPTPNPTNSILDTSIVGECIKWCECPIIVVRSTVNPGDCHRWEMKYMKHILYQPEYLGETPDHPLLNTQRTPFIIIGGSTREDRRELIDLYGTVYNANIRIRQMSLLEAEIVKLSENRAIAFQVAECQELYDACEKAGVDYYAIREAVYGDDPRFHLWWTFVYPDARGFNSKCIPKDVYAWSAWAESLGYDPKITNAALERNKEWISK